jgi:hypothetical protein
MPLAERGVVVSTWSRPAKLAEDAIGLTMLWTFVEKPLYESRVTSP